MEFAFNEIKPNLYVYNGNIYVGIDAEGIVPASRDIDYIVGKHIGELRVKKSDLEVLLRGRTQARSDEKCDTPLKSFLDKAQVNDFLYNGQIGPYSTALFNVGYFIDAQTFEKCEDIFDWEILGKALIQPDKMFDAFNRSQRYLRIDRERTLAESMKLFEELDSKMPLNFADFLVMNGYVQPGISENLPKVARIQFKQVKDKNGQKIEEARQDLIERLKDVKGPRLSFDAPDLINQATTVYLNSNHLIDNFGDIIYSPNWMERLFNVRT